MRKSEKKIAAVFKKNETGRDSKYVDAGVFLHFSADHAAYGSSYVYEIFHVVQAGNDGKLQKTLEQTGESMEDYLVNMRQISDAVYYNVVKENDFYDKREEIQKGMNLLYEANRDKLRTIAIYNKDGSLVAAEPVASQKRRSGRNQAGMVPEGHG